jgi:ribosome-associated toxin RatA of RatAB toxin-antitoxin module
VVTVERQAMVAHSADKMYALVDDVESYPHFLPWCSGADVALRDEQRTVATLHVDFRGVKQQFTTDNAKRPGERIQMQLVRGPFRRLQGEWRFKRLAAEACKVELTLAWQLANPLLDRLIGPIFDYIATTFVDAFVRRADVVYGRG